jgi:hypothetical protein
VRTIFLGAPVIVWLASAKQAFLSLMSSLRVNPIPHLVSFPTPGHGRQVYSVEAKHGLSFL